MSLPYSAEPIRSDRLTLEPLRVEHAAETQALLDDSTLHHYTGGQPLTLAELTDRYQALSAEISPDKREMWLNWVLRYQDSTIGYVQATVWCERPDVADIAWVVAAEWQNNGFATEATKAMTTWLAGKGVSTFHADIHPEHQASIGVAKALGMHPTQEIVDGEVRWSCAATDLVAS